MWDFLFTLNNITCLSLMMFCGQMVEFLSESLPEGHEEFLSDVAAHLQRCLPVHGTEPGKYSA